ncbi:MAG: hypothetical protein IH991_13070 [Planctomycetes bacterium]|nr:hypothetical protein [Planctomycetota bacterium]
MPIADSQYLVPVDLALLGPSDLHYVLQGFGYPEFVFPFFWCPEGKTSDQP